MTKPTKSQLKQEEKNERTKPGIKRHQDDVQACACACATMPCHATLHYAERSMSTSVPELSEAAQCVLSGLHVTEKMTFFNLKTFSTSVVFMFVRKRVGEEV